MGGTCHTHGRDVLEMSQKVITWRTKHRQEDNIITCVREAVDVDMELTDTSRSSQSSGP